MGNLLDCAWKGNVISYRKGKKVSGEVFYDAWINDDYLGMFDTYADIFNTLREMQAEGFIA